MDAGKTTGVRNARTAVEKMMADGGWERLRFSALGALVLLVWYVWRKKLPLLHL